MRYYEVKATEGKNYHFQLLLDRTATNVTVYLLKHPEAHYLEGEKLAEGLRGDFDLVVDSPTRPYFYLITDQFQEKVAERTLPVDGMNNFRDMGGYVANKKRVKWGKLYRSDQIYNATEKGLQYLRELDLKSIVDYRSDDEISKYPNKIISPDIQTYNLDPDAHAAELSAQFSASKEAEDVDLIQALMQQKTNNHLVNRYDIVMEQYRNFVEKEPSQQAFKKMLQIAASADTPMDQHCRGGKDRTGYGSMLLLGMLGVSESDLVSDYMLTYENRLKRNETKMARYRKLTKDKDILNYLYSLIETRADFIEESLQLIHSKYGSILDYGQSVLGITNQEIERLHTLYLE